jgi:hypothetical protein
MVPQDGFLFDITVRDNVRAGRQMQSTARSRRRSRSSDWASGSRACPRAWARGSASGASRYRWASASSSRSCGRRSGTRVC